jgi:cysteine-rich repeat protein
LTHADDEECDDGNRADTDACLNNCELARCGDRVVHENVETCDDGNESNTDACINTCQIASCGDSYTHEGEEDCDDANNDDFDACRNSCAAAACGDGVQRRDLNDGEEGYEACDDNNRVDGDNCTNICLNQRCGDGVLRTNIAEGQPGAEVCDDGNEADNDACRNSCVAASCGDGVVRNDLIDGDEGYEQCEDENQLNTDACTNACLNATCGDGFLHAGSDELCDDGNAERGDGCGPTCFAEPVDVSSGYLFGCAVMFDGKVKCWGSNRYGQLGDNTLTEKDEPVSTAGEMMDRFVFQGNISWTPALVTQVATGTYHSCARSSRGSGFCWGNNAYGQISSGSMSPRTTPVRLEAEDIDQFSAGYLNTCYRTSGGQAYCMGLNAHGQLGNGNRVSTSIPQLVIDGGVSDIQSGYLHSCAIVSGRVYCWGYNTYGSIGNNTTNMADRPVLVHRLGDNVDQLALGRYHGCARQGGDVYCWGRNSSGQTDPASNSDQLLRPNLTPIGNLGSVVDLALGHSHTCVLNDAGETRCFGANQDGQLGQGNRSERGFPALISWSVDRLGTPRKLSVGTYHTCMRNTVNRVYCWGRSTSGQLGNEDLYEETVDEPPLRSRDAVDFYQ